MYLEQGSPNENKVFLCQARASSDIEIDANLQETENEITIKQLPCRVKSTEKLNDSVIRIILELPKTELLEFLPGQYVDFILPNNKKHHEQKIQVVAVGALYSDYFEFIFSSLLSFFVPAFIVKPNYLEYQI